MKKSTLNTTSSRRWLHAAGFAAMTLLLTGCAYRPVTPAPYLAERLTSNLHDCRELLSNSIEAAELDASRISLFNWNVHKTRSDSWSGDFDAYAADSDIVLFQEASIRESTINKLDSSRHWSFAPGYTRRGEVTGVMTLSRAKPMTSCSFAHSEPWLRTPKATSITQFGLSGTDQTLVVANVHAVNFSFGTAAYEQQFAEIHQLLANHDGPIILSGDLNTWRDRRIEIVDQLASELDLTAVKFAEDNRTRVFGNVLDHIYVRGLQTVTADTRIVTSSDHNPMMAILSLQ